MSFKTDTISLYITNYILHVDKKAKGLPKWQLVVKNSPAKARDSGDAGSIPGLERFPGGGYVNRLQYSCLGNPMDRGAWPATVHGVTKSQT